ncbi:hypothetical protein PUNSTDRAFT_25394, partial [Punctularia strigosozonata HHB-11173 SS5]|uniref:uncharacterized protein n=1 Tax=Punctularia strigosozonata (strain HHB-11173) TaxID=741275 RepID=UPI0004417105
SAVGVSVLNVRGKLGSLEEEEINLRFDSGADISLISEEYLESMKNPPKIKQGMRMQLWQLTSGDTKMKGYVTIPVFVRATDGCTLELEVEAYVVPGMSVPILLGEDFAYDHELGATRDALCRAHIFFRRSTARVRAEPARRSDDLKHVRRSVAKNREGRARRVVRAKEDTLIAPGTVRNVEVEADLGEDPDKEWLVSKGFLVDSASEKWPLPNTLIRTSDPRVPMANTSTRPRYIRKGDVLGELQDPESYFDRSANFGEAERMTERAS